MKYKNRYLYYSILPCLLFLIAIGVYVSGYNPPTENPPYGNLPAPINAGPEAQSKEGDLTIEGNLITEGILKLGQFATADIPAGVEGALCFDTTKKSIQVYTSNAWRDLMVVKLGLGETCNLDNDCDLGHCVDGYCCNDSCSGICEACNLAGSLGSCKDQLDGTDPDGDCTGNCDICSSGNCVADASLCAGDAVQCIGSGTEYSCSANPDLCSGNCVQVTGSGTEYNCAPNPDLCTGNCSFCNGSGTEYNCAGSNGFCSNTTSSCYCGGSGTVWNCQSCPVASGVCQTGGGCSGYSCVAVTNLAINSQPSGCTGCNFCNSAGSCVNCHWVYDHRAETCWGSSGWSNCKPSTITTFGFSNASPYPNLSACYQSSIMRFWGYPPGSCATYNYFRCTCD